MREHLRSLWGNAWPVLGLVLIAYVVLLGAVGGLRPEHGVAVAAVAFLGYFSPRTKAFLKDIAPYVVVGVGYDSVRYARRLAQDVPVHTCDLRAAEQSLFGVGGGTLNDWFAAHHHPVIDVAAAVPYAIFAYIALIYAGYLYFKDRPRMRHFLWAFAIANYLAFAIWLVFPAAPPWYVRANGCAVDLAAQPSAAALLRVDQLFGMSYFETFYSRTASVFGAMPSMHCAYPALGLFTAWKHIGLKTRWIHLVYVAWMALAAVYLDHHYVLDVAAGWAVAGVATLLAGWLLRRSAGSVSNENARAAGDGLRGEEAQVSA